MGTNFSFSRGQLPVVPVETQSSNLVVVPVAEPKSVRTIVINQATCYGCNKLLVNEGICRCGNVEIYGGTNELGRRVKRMELYSDCSLVEYTRTAIAL